MAGMNEGGASSRTSASRTQSWPRRTQWHAAPPAEASGTVVTHDRYGFPLRVAAGSYSEFAGQYLLRELTQRRLWEASGCAPPPDGRPSEQVRSPRPRRRTDTAPSVPCSPLVARSHRTLPPNAPTVLYSSPAPPPLVATVRAVQRFGSQSPGRSN